MTVARSGLHAGAVSDDSRAGLAMFLIFTAAVLIVTGAVALLALVGGRWMLGLAFAIHVLMTTLVVATIAFVMDGPTSAATSVSPRPTAGARADLRRRPTRSPHYERLPVAHPRRARPDQGDRGARLAEPPDAAAGSARRGSAS